MSESLNRINIRRNSFYLDKSLNRILRNSMYQCYHDWDKDFEQKASSFLKTTLEEKLLTQFQIECKESSLYDVKFIVQWKPNEYFDFVEIDIKGMRSEGFLLDVFGKYGN